MPPPRGSVSFPLPDETVRRFPGALRLSALAFTFLLGACALNFDTRSLGVPVSMAEPLAQQVAGDTFRVTSKAVHVFWGLGLAHQPDLRQAIAGQLGTGGAVHNLAIHTHKNVFDILITVVSVGVVAPTSVTFSGVITHGTP